MRRLGLLALATVWLVAACSGGGSSSAAKATTTTAGAVVSTTSTVPVFSGSKNSKYCNLAGQFIQTLNPNLSSDPKTLFQEFDALASQYLAVVPSEIKADATVLIDAIKQLETGLKAANFDVTKINPADLASVQDPKFTTATNRINAYDSQVCGITTPTT